MLKPQKGYTTVPWSRQVAYELQDLLGEKLEHPHESVAYKAIRATFKVIKDALIRGEKVMIPGFGVFSVKKVKSHGRRVFWMYKYDPNIKMTPSNSPKGWKVIPERKYAHFKPYPALKKLVNEGYQDDES